MGTVKRSIKFCYYKVAQVDAKGKIIGKYNLTEWLSKMTRKNLFQKNIQLSDCKVHFDRLELVRDKIYYIQACKLREVNIPLKVKDGEKSHPIKLASDEYIGEDINFIYDRRNSVCMLQQNRYSIGVSRLVEWINKYHSDNSCSVAFLPICAKFTSDRIRNKKIRKIEFSFANLESMKPDGSLGSIINSIGKYKGTNAKIVISSGRVKNNELDKTNILDLVHELKSNPGIVKDGRVSLRQEKMYDDDKAHLEVVDIFEDALNSIISFDIETRKPLDYKQAETRMLEEYDRNYEMINKLCGW